ncbi:hypothetical protein [Streptomyces sp. NPDC017991]
MPLTNPVLRTDPSPLRVWWLLAGMDGLDAGARVRLGREGEQEPLGGVGG